MPTSSERLRARARVYGKVCDVLADMANASGDAVEFEEFERLAERLLLDYDRLNKLADIREEKEQGLEHRRKTD